MLHLFYCFVHVLLTQYFDYTVCITHVQKLSYTSIIRASSRYSGAETWSVTVILSRTIDALDNWCLRRILNIHWSEFVTNDEIRSRTGQPFLSDTVHSRRLSFIGHLYRADPGRIITELSRPAFQAHLTTGDGGLDVHGNPGSEPWRPTCDL